MLRVVALEQPCALAQQLMATNNLPLPTPAPPTDPLASGKRLAGWEHYYTYFHKLDADMQVSETRRCRCLSLFA